MKWFTVCEQLARVEAVHQGRLHEVLSGDPDPTYVSRVTHLFTKRVVTDEDSLGNVNSPC